MDETEKRILKIIDSKREEIIAFARDIYDHAELGYKEFKTAAKFEKVLQEHGLKYEKGLAVTGVKGYLNEEKKDNFSLALIGELDALRIPTHSHANPETEAAHCCGHHAQMAGIMGALLALCDESVAAGMDGQVIFFAVPSEEYGEIEFKNQLKAEGKIVYGGGKSELIRIGAFDDVDMSIVHHTQENDEISVGSGTHTGFVSQVIRYLGREAHAASEPEKGINALNAASIGLTALAYQRETFRDEDSVRVHPIITKGGNLVNVIPNEVVVETLIRAKNVEAMDDACLKTTRAFKAGADAMGAGYVIETMPGYLPTLGSEANPSMYEAALSAAPGRTVKRADPRSHSGGSTDVGDVEHIQPVLTFNTGGARGGAHTNTYEIYDEELAYVVTAKIFALTAYKLLKDGAAEAKKVKEEYKPKFTKEEYIAFMDSKMVREEKGLPRD